VVTGDVFLAPDSDICIAIYSRLFLKHVVPSNFTQSVCNRSGIIVVDNVCVGRSKPEDGTDPFS